MAEAAIDTLERRSLELAEARRLLAIIAPHPARMRRVGEATREIDRELLAEESVEDRMRVRPRRAIGLTTLEPQRAEALSIEER
jgi:hypothetical protein